MEAWVGLVGVVIGGMIGLIPVLAGRRDARRQEERAEAREREEETRRASSHVTGALVRCAQMTNEFLAAWQFHVDAGELPIQDEATQLSLLRDSHARASEMRTAWTEALVVVPRSDPRNNVIRQMLSKAWTAPDSGPELGALALTAEHALKQLIGTEPPP